MQRGCKVNSFLNFFWIFFGVRGACIGAALQGPTAPDALAIGVCRQPPRQNRATCSGHPAVES